jgi:hypothetical protein
MRRRFDRHGADRENSLQTLLGTNTPPSGSRCLVATAGIELPACGPRPHGRAPHRRYRQHLVIRTIADRLRRRVEVMTTAPPAKAS